MVSGFFCRWMYVACGYNPQARCSGLGNRSSTIMFVRSALFFLDWINKHNIVHSTDPNSSAVAGNRPGVDSKLGEADSRPVPLGSNTRKDRADSRDLMLHQMHSQAQ